MLAMRGEYITGVVLTLGLLHRGTEKLMEMRHAVTSYALDTMGCTIIPGVYGVS